MELADRLAALMKSRGGLSANKLAKMSGVAQTQISRILRGESTVTVETLKLICAALGVTVCEFMEPNTANQYESIKASSDEIEFLLNYRAMSAKERDALSAMARVLTEQDGPHTLDGLYDKLDAAKLNYEQNGQTKNAK